MELIFLGTASGAPTKSRNVSGLALCAPSNKHWYLVDCGEGTQHQLLHTKLSLHNLKAIFITHMHGDHCYGLPGLLGSAALSGRKAPLLIVCPENVELMIKAVQQHTKLRLEFELEFKRLEQIDGPLRLEAFDVTATALSHRVPSWGFTFVERNIASKLNLSKLKADGIEAGPEWGELQKGHDVVLADGRTLVAADYQLEPRAPRTVFVGGDNDNPQLLDNIGLVPDVVVHESTYTEEIYEKVGREHRHSCAKMVAEYAHSVGVKNLILTHFSARFCYGKGRSASISEVESEARAYYQGTLFLANDFDVFVLDKAHCLNKI